MAGCSWHLLTKGQSGYSTSHNEEVKNYLASNTSSASWETASFRANMTQGRVIWKEGVLIEKMPP